MTELRFEPSEVIFREGDASRYVGRVLEGEVEVLKHVGEREVQLGTVKSGEFVGEMGVLEGRPRGATVRAVTAVRLEVLGEDDFLDRVSRDPKTALQALRRLSERLRAADERLVNEEQTSPGASEPPEAPVPPPSTPKWRVRLRADSDRTKHEIPQEGIAIREFPFYVGRPAGRRERPGDVALGLAIPDDRPYRLSRVHFGVLIRQGQVGIRDVNSTLGTVVNGALIGQYAPRNFAPLDLGENRIVAGGSGSPYAFRITLTL